MDLRSLCSKIDMDAIRAKIPPLPQIKLPKSMSKLKSRKIFRSSRENVNSVSRSVSSKRKPSNCDNLASPFGAPYAVPPSGLINRTPNRISTISSLMNRRDNEDGISIKSKSKYNEDEHFYRSAGGIDDYYPSPLNERFQQRRARPISPVRAPPITQEIFVQSDQNIKMSFGERLQKGYKDATEFKLKHLFAKRTVVRSDKIEITEYIHRFDEERLRDQKIQRRIDRDVADNYRFQFKVSKQESEESYIDSPASGKPNTEYKAKQKTVSELSGDESGMESSPPPRKPGIASTRFNKVRRTPLSMSLEDNSDDEDGIHTVEADVSKINSYKSSKPIAQARQSSANRPMEADEDDVSEDEVIIDDVELNVVDVNTPKIKANQSSLHAKKKQQTPEKSSNTQSPRRLKSIKERMGRLTKQKSQDDEKNHRVTRSPQKGEENEVDPSKSDKPFETIKQNFKRLQKSIKIPQQVPAEGENDGESNNNKIVLSITQELSERIKRFRSTEQINKNAEDDENKENKESPMHKITVKLQEWKNRVKKKVELHNTDNEDEYDGSSSQKPIGSLMNKLKHIRSRKGESTEDPDDDEEGGETYKESLAARAKLQLEKGVVVASQVPQKTMKKISDTKKFFKKKQENTETKQHTDKPNSDEEIELELDEGNEKVDPKPIVKTICRPPPPIPRPYIRNSSEEEDSDDRQAFIKKSIAESQLIALPAARAIWTTKPILADDTIDYDDELPRVLLHQDNSDGFESTLIIAVTRPISRTTTPIITELPPDTPEESTPAKNADNWIPHQDVGATISEMTPPLQRKLSKDSDASSASRYQSRNQSIDSSSEESWIKDIPRGPSIAVPSSICENEKPWKIQTGNPRDCLYKTKSIDLFEMQKKHGGVLTAFEDFDDELKNTPVFKIESEEPLDNNTPQSTDYNSRESSEELENPDDDNSSRVTRISVHPQDSKQKEEIELKPQPYANSHESMAANLDDEDHTVRGVEDDNVANSNHDYKESEALVNNEIEKERPPSKAPSAASSASATPPPLPQRKPSIIAPLDLTCPLEPPPPLPLTRPPIPPNRPTLPAPPPKIPDRNPMTARVSKPLVKTASLRLAYSEQVNPEDVGKVNKLISRFEPDIPNYKPKIIPRKPWMANESEEYSDDEDSFELLPAKQKEKAKDATPTNHPRIQKSFSIDSIDLPNNNEKLTASSQPVQVPFPTRTTSQIILDNSESAIPIPSISVSSSCLDVNSNFSQPSSVYGSPLPYPSSLVGSTEVTPLATRKESEHLGTKRNRRSLARDDEHFYSFDSDEENSYYSISSTSSNRYVIEL